MDHTSSTAPAAAHLNPDADHPPRVTGWFARAAVAAPVLAVFAIAVGAPIYTSDLADAATTSRLLVANGVTLGVLLLLHLALIGIYLHGQHRFGPLGQVGFVIALVGTVLAAGGAWDSLFSLPYIADKAPAMLDDPTGGSLLAGFVVSYVVLVVGWVAMGIASMRARVVSRTASIVLIVGAVFAILPAPTAIRLLPLAIGAALAGRAILRTAESTRGR